MLTVEIWSDVMCPWCYLGRLSWQAALSRFPAAGAVRTVHRSFELRPHLPPGQGRRLVDIMTDDWAMPPAEIEDVFSRIRTTGTSFGTELRPEIVRPVNTFDMHRVVQLAQHTGQVEPLLDALFDAYHARSADLSDHRVLRELAEAVGVDGGRVAAVLAGDEYAERVRADEQLAREVGVRAVPSFRFAGGPPVSEWDPDWLLEQLTAGLDGVTATR